MENRLNLTDIKALKEIIRNLRRIKEHGTAPINITRYKNYGLIRIPKARLTKKSYLGTRIREKSGKIYLTEKAKRILRVKF